MISVPGLISPIALQLGPFAIHWYGIAYALSFIMCHQWVKHRIKTQSISIINVSQWDELLQSLVFGMLIGGRLGYVVFYQTHWLLDPVKIISIWQGGMSFHGACIGIFGVMSWFAYRQRCSVIDLFDALLPFAPLGLFLGRIANFINGELPGRISDVPWAVIFKHVDQLPRHPSPLYEALGEGVVLGAILYFVSRYQRKGVVSSVFLMAYGGIRFVLEFFREPDIQIGYIASYFTLGQMFCAVMVVMGMIVWSVVFMSQLTNNEHQQKAQ